MGSKYQRYQPERRSSREKQRKIHPIWRGIGFGLIVLFPIIAYAAMEVLISSKWFPLPTDLFAKPGHFIYKLIPDQLIYIKALIMISIILLLSLIFTFISYIVNSAFGNTARDDPYYVPPIKRKSRRKY